MKKVWDALLWVVSRLLDEACGLVLWLHCLRELRCMHPLWNDGDGLRCYYWMLKRKKSEPPDDWEKRKDKCGKLGDVRSLDVRRQTPRIKSMAQGRKEKKVDRKGEGNNVKLCNLGGVQPSGQGHNRPWPVPDLILMPSYLRLNVRQAPISLCRSTASSYTETMLDCLPTFRDLKT